MRKNPIHLSRRRFIQGLGASAAGLAAMSDAPSTARAAARGGEEPMEQVFTACDMCFNRCAVIAQAQGQGQNRRALKLDPNPHCSKSRGMLCARGNAGIAQLTDPDRLTVPLLRDGPRGSGQWKQISWDEALDRAAEAMRRIGAKYSRCGMLFSAGADTQSQFVHRFAEAFGSFNITSHESLCLLSGNRAFMDTFGEVPQADLLHTEYVVMLGANRFESLCMPDSADLMLALQRGAKLVVLDPRLTKTAELATEWHAIRPGTDMAFLLALCHVILNENLYDANWVAANTSGLEALRAHVATCTPQWAEAETGIRAEHITRIARELAAAAPKAVIYPGRRSSDYVDSTQIRRTFAIVNALLANFDRKGGLLATPGIKLQGIPFDPPWYDDNPEDRADAGVVPLLDNADGSFVLMRECVLSGQPYPVRGWFIYKTNPMAMAPDRERTKAMLEAMEYVVTVDIVMSDTAYFSDLVLPAPSYLERLDPVFVSPGGAAGPCILTRNPVMLPLGQCRPVFDIMKALATRLEFPEAFAFTMEDLREKQMNSFPGLKEALETQGVFEPEVPLYGLREGQPYKTPSKKIELYAILYEQKGLDPLPVYTPPPALPKGTFLLVAGRNACITQSYSQNNALLAELAPTNTLWMHPLSAEQLGITDGDTITVHSSRGAEELRAELTTGIRPDTVYMHSGYGGISPGQRRVHENGASIAALLEGAYDKATGNAALHTTRVTISRKGGRS